MEPLYVGSLRVRVWRQEEEDAVINNDDLRTLADDMTVSCNFHDPLAVAKEIAKMPRVNAVEVVDSDKRGVVVYLGWP